jgi:hypothetical protein
VSALLLAVALLSPQWHWERLLLGAGVSMHRIRVIEATNVELGVGQPWDFDGDDQ